MLLKPEKICKTCDQPFTWRKKWRKDWEYVLIKKALIIRAFSLMTL
ncbi:MAG: DUF2256 domain-containing protein [Candidatus Thioglobus sp.]|nr:DUF2256 domain-containing protein [Candidatus Thioglobus sp.]